VKALRGRYVCEVACGAAHTLVLTSTGEVFSCGIGVYGALGHGDLVDARQPKLIQVSPARAGDLSALLVGRCSPQSRTR
jgi:alpha-tubulin suppressor-like RCC1 family protein